MGKADRKQKALLKAVLEPRKPGALEKIAASCAAGADPNATVPETSTANGFVRGGSTLLTHSVHEEASYAVKALLTAGADPNRVDDNGWTPWMATTLIDESKQRKIREALLAAGAKPAGEHIGVLARALFSGDLGGAKAVLESEADLRVLATFRVDLVGRAAADRNTEMLEFLLDGGMTPTETHLDNASRGEYLAGVDLLLDHGVPPEDDCDEETLLMTSAAEGSLDIVQRLVAAGADVNRAGHGDPMWTPSFYAESAGHTEVAQWLKERMDSAVLERQAQIRESRRGPFSLLYDKATSGEGTTTEELVAALTRWNSAFGVSLDDATHDALTITFATLPKKGDELYVDILDVCPELADSADDLFAELQRDKTLSFWWD